LFSDENGITLISITYQNNMKKTNIAKRPTMANNAPVTDEAMSEFIGSAPDGSKPEKPQGGLKRGKRAQISHTLPPELLEKADDKAVAMGLTRAGFINLALSEYLNK
jgi:hypothetical protein